MYTNLTPIAEYGTILVSSTNLAAVRGSGNFNPASTFVASTNRGPADQNAFPMYAHQSDYYGKSTDKPNPNNYSNPNVYTNNFNNIIPKADNNPYRVGITQFIDEPTGPNFGFNNQNFKNIDSYQEWALKALNQQPSALLLFYFSEDNVNYIHNTVISEIQRIRNTKIARQSDNELLIIMRNHFIYFQNGWIKNPDSPDKVHMRGPVSRPGLAYAKNGLEQQIELLNTTTVEECVKQILSGIDMYLQYYKDASSLPMPLERPTLTSMKGNNILQENIGFTDGENIPITNYNERVNMF